MVFVIAEAVPQLAWRCAERAKFAKRDALAALRAPHLAGAEATEQALAHLANAERCLAAARHLVPRDHEFLQATAGLHVMRGEAAAARACACAAAVAYEFCPKPRLALGSLLLEAGRTRAALRHFEAALAASAHEDDDDAWEARCNGGLAVVRLRSWEREGPPPPGAPPRSRKKKLSWISALLSQRRA